MDSYARMIEQTCKIIQIKFVMGNDGVDSMDVNFDL